MIDSDNVLLVRPVSGLALDADDRAAPGSTRSQPGLLAVTIYALREPNAADFPRFFERELEPALRDGGVTVLATYVTEHRANTFPALPVREEEEVFIWLALFADEDDHAGRMSALARTPAWHDVASPALSRYLNGPIEVLRLTPTARSLLHG